MSLLVCVALRCQQVKSRSAAQGYRSSSKVVRLFSDIQCCSLVSLQSQAGECKRTNEIQKAQSDSLCLKNYSGLVPFLSRLRRSRLSTASVSPDLVKRSAKTSFTFECKEDNGKDDPDFWEELGDRGIQHSTI